MSFKKLTSLLLSSLLLFFNVGPALAMSFKDVKQDHWAYKEIKWLTDSSIIAGYPDKTFKPENTVNRAEFTKMVIKTLDKDDMPISTKNTFSDISPDFWAYGDILRAKELGLVVGYPDNTFQPCNEITKEEVTSLISKTVKKDCQKGCPCGCNGIDENCISCASKKNKDCVLKKFTDYEKIANWARKSYAVAVKNDLYVNHPDEKTFTPDKKMTRAETAALLYKLRQNPSVIMADFQGPKVKKEAEKEKLVSNKPAPKKLKAEEFTTVVEHLPATPYTGEVNEVVIKGAEARILAYNVFPVRFQDGFEGKEANEGEIVNLVFTKDLKTEEGTTVVPEGSLLVGEITTLSNGKLFHRNGKMELAVQNLITPTGKVYPLNAQIENNDVLNKKFGKCNFKKMGIVGGTIAATGAVLGVSIGAMAGETGEGSALGAIIGAGVGLLAGLAAPGCDVSIPEEQEIYIKLDKDLKVKTK